MRRSLTALTLSLALGFGILPAAAQQAPSTDASANSFSTTSTDSTESNQNAESTENSDSSESSTDPAETGSTDMGSTNTSSVNAPSSDALSSNSSNDTGSSAETFIGLAAIVAVIGGIAAAVHWAMLQGFIPNPFQPPAPAPAPAPAPIHQAPRQAVPVQHAQYPNCKAVWNQLGRPIRSHEPGYHRGLDADGDGVGCEKRPR